ncbi:hypothetical protein [Catellatospora chokoriensis]|uniref:Uncharacterized protein n=1 Tax=Catellatospora chokoriensis TaxID=310353 RepID=A0A8J3K2W9_9ACTN|nr:hypothetical protein [Catellatospora chokoriensis]GIF91853.1 hypothetical protein Cch02nite_52970 [Catellatospora chokoriensis]
MNDVKDLCERILDQPAPPLRDSAQVLAVARHAAQRRARLTAAVGGLACAAVAAVVVTAALPRTAGELPVAQPPSATALASAAAMPPVPGPDAAQAHGGRIAQLLAEAVPAGYTGRPADATSTWRLDTDTAGTPRYISQTRLIVSDGAGEGVLSAALAGDRHAAPVGDLCADAVTARLAEYSAVGPGTCDVVSVGGAAVRVDTAADRAVVATRFLAGGYLTIRWSPMTWSAVSPSASAQPWMLLDGGGRPALDAAAFTPAGLAGLAADPRLLP